MIEYSEKGERILFFQKFKDTVIFYLWFFDIHITKIKKEDKK